MRHSVLVKPAGRRIPPIPSNLDEETAALVDLVTRPDGTRLHTVAVLAHQPALMGPFLAWAAALSLQSALPRRDHELLALRTARNFESTFEWDEHADYARHAGVSETELSSVSAGRDARTWTDHERALLVAADELHDDHQISDETWRVLARHYDVAQLVEIPYVVGQYAMLSMVANVLARDE
jgi:alkylhydroperoxidase family enzyme